MKPLLSVSSAEKPCAATVPLIPITAVFVPSAAGRNLYRNAIY